MHKDPITVDDGHVRRRTRLARHQQDSILRQATLLRTDPDAVLREAKGYCAICHYTQGGIAGCAFTYQDCGLCGATQSYASTATDALCLACANAHRLCKSCGADRALDSTRTGL